MSDFLLAWKRWLFPWALLSLYAAPFWRHLNEFPATVNCHQPMTIYSTLIHRNAGNVNRLGIYISLRRDRNVRGSKRLQYDWLH